MKLFRAKYPSMLRLLYPERISTIKGPKAIYLTFDDGPIPEITPWVLAQLKKFNAKATFFCIGENVKKYPEIFQQILTEGHSIGNHTHHHLNGWKTKTSTYLKNIQLAEETIGKQEIENTKLFRPPYGKIKNSQAKLVRKLGFTIVMWDVVSGDYNQVFSTEECFENVVKNASAGSIIVFHDSKKALQNLQQILPEVLQFYSKKELEFKGIKAAL